MVVSLQLGVLCSKSLELDLPWMVEWSGTWSAAAGVELEFRTSADGVAYTRAAKELAARTDGVLLLAGASVPRVELGEFASRRPEQVVLVDLDAAERPRPRWLHDIRVAAVRGRGIDGVRWAAAHLARRLSTPFRTLPYGGARDQVADLRMPHGGAAPPYPVIVLLHGGFWRERWEPDTIEPLAVDLASRGFATWNVEYRRVGPFGGGWPSTCLDVGASVDALASLDVEIDLSQVVLVGHSAGAQLAVTAAVRSDARVRPALVVSLAGVLDLVGCSRRGLGDTGNAAEAFAGGPPESFADVYRAGSPLELLPIGIPQIVVQGTSDSPDLVDMGRKYALAAQRANDCVSYLEIPGADHFDLISPGSSAWTRTLSALREAGFASAATTIRPSG